MEQYYIPQEHRENLYKLARDFFSVVHDHKIQYWIEGGTLLGSIRQGDQTLWDDDIDISMLTKDFDNLSRYFPTFEKMGYTCWTDGWLSKVYMEGKSTKTPSGGYVATPCIDIFLYKQTNKYVRLAHLGYYKKWPEAKFQLKDLYPLRDYKYHDMLLKGPNNGIPYLDALYPDWRRKAVIDVRSKELKDAKVEFIFNIPF